MGTKRALALVEAALANLREADMPESVRAEQVPILEGELGDVGEYASIAAQPDGTLHAVAFDQTQLLDALGRPIGRVYDLRYARRAPGGAWTASTIDERGDVGRHASIATTAEGFVYVVYFDETYDDLRVMRRCP